MGSYYEIAGENFKETWDFIQETNVEIEESKKNQKGKPTTFYR